MASLFKVHLVFILSILYLVPVGLVYAGILPFSLRFHFLIAVTLVTVLLFATRQESLVELGIKNCNWKSDFLPYFLITLPFLIILALAPKTGLAGRKFIPSSINFYIFYILVSSPCQEFLYRAALRVAVKQISESTYLYIIISAVLYSLLHIVYKDAFTLAITFVIGIVWAAVYWKHPNLFLVSLSHAILGLVTIRLGLI